MPSDPTPEDQASRKLLLDPYGQPLKSKAKRVRWASWTTDHSLIATFALSVISLCALIVSIYQVRILSSQQRAMEAQQEMMVRNAKAQLWPSVLIGQDVEFDKKGIKQLKMNITNTGTGHHSGLSNSGR